MLSCYFYLSKIFPWYFYFYLSNYVEYFVQYCEFQAENFPSGSNDLPQLFRKWNIKLGGLGGRVVTYLTFTPDCRKSRIPVGKRNLFVYIYRRYLINAMLLYVEFMCVLLIMISSVQYKTAIQSECSVHAYFPSFLCSKLCTEWYC